MSNPKFYATDLALQAFTWSAGADPLYPADNLNNYIAAILSKSNVTTENQRIYTDFGAAKTCDFCAIDNNNFDVLYAYATTIKIEAANNAAFSSNYVLLYTFDHSPLDQEVIEFASTSRRYFGIKFEKVGALYTKPEIGNLFFDAKHQFEYNYDMDVEKGHKKFLSSIKEALDGTLRSCRQVEGRKRMECTFSMITNNDVASWMTLMDKIKGKANPFYFKDDADILSYVHFEEDYLPAKGRRVNVNDLIRLKMMKQLIG